MIISNTMLEMIRALEHFTSKVDLVFRFLYICRIHCSFSAVIAVLHEEALTPILGIEI